MQPSVRLDHNLVAVESEQEVNVMLELAVPEPEADAPRTPLRLALVLDRSGSMQGDKLDVAKRCARWLISRLHPSDEVALVDYDDEVRLLSPVGAPHAHADAMVDQIWPGGQTNLSGGWLKGVEQLRGAGGKVLLLTDGLANVGITDTDAIVGLATGAAGDGVGTSTIGIGSDFDEDLLTAMADAGGGNAHYAPTPEAAPAIFAQEFDGLTKLVAQNVSVEIRPAQDVEFLTVLNEFPQVPVEGGVQVQLGDAYGGDARRVIFTLHVPALAELGVVKIGELVLRYVSVGDQVAAHELTVPIVVNLVSADEAAAAQPDFEVTEEVLILKAARARDEAISLADAGSFDSAKLALRSPQSLLAAHPRQSKRLQDELAALAEAETTLDAYSPAARKKLRFESNQRRRRRTGDI